MVNRFRVSAGNGIACEVSNISSLFQTIVLKEASMLSHPGDSVKMQTTYLNNNSVEILPLVLDSDIAGSMRDLLIRTNSLEEECSKKTAQENFNAMDKVQVVIGSEKWLLANDVKLEEKVFETLINERLLGNISLLCAINGGYFYLNFF